jgi:hypothetical protein
MNYPNDTRRLLSEEMIAGGAETIGFARQEPDSSGTTNPT